MVVDMHGRTIEPPVAEPVKEPSQRTARNAIIAGVLLVAAVILGAQLFSGGWARPLEMERYIRLGARQGAVELERDLRREFAPGSGVGPVFAQLSRMGFRCGGSADPLRAGECRFRGRRRDDQIVTAIVEIEQDGVRMQSIAVRMLVGPN